MRKVMTVPRNTAKMLANGVKKGLDYSRIHLVTRVHEDLEFLVSRWIMKTHTFIVARESLDQLLRMFWNLWLCLYTERRRRWV